MPALDSSERLNVRSHQRDAAYESLRRMLVCRRIPEGERLREMAWSGRLCVSRSAVREALSRLCAEGLVIEGPKIGYEVPRLTPQELKDTQEARSIIESAAIDWIIRQGRCRRENLAPLHKLCDEFEWMLRRNYTVELGEADRRFHEALVQLTGSRQLQMLYRCIPYVDPSERNAAECDWNELGERMVASHRALLNAIHKQLGNAAELLNCYAPGSSR